MVNVECDDDAVIDDPEAAAPGRYGRRRPRPGLTPDRIRAGARRVIERDGLDALSMRAVAAELDTAAGSLYRHVADRDALLQSVLEEIAAGLPVEVAGDEPRDRLTGRFVAFHDYMAGHIWVLHVLVAGSLVARNALPFTDRCIADFRAAGLDVQAAGRAFRVCYHLTLGELLDTHPLVPPIGPTPRDLIVAAAEPGDVPDFVALRDAGGGRTAEQYPISIGLLIDALLDRPT